MHKPRPGFRYSGFRPSKTSSRGATTGHSNTSCNPVSASVRCATASRHDVNSCRAGLQKSAQCTAIRKRVVSSRAIPILFLTSRFLELLEALDEREHGPSADGLPIQRDKRSNPLLGNQLLGKATELSKQDAWTKESTHFEDAKGERGRRRPHKACRRTDPGRGCTHL